MSRETKRAKSNEPRRCAICNEPIPAGRLEVLPDATTCVACATKNPQKVDLSRFELSQASPINRNGFAPSD